jgi:AraC-like DNA-binding protein
VGGIGFGFEKGADADRSGFIVRVDTELADDRDESDSVAMSQLTRVLSCVETDHGAVWAGLGVAPQWGGTVVGVEFLETEVLHWGGGRLSGSGFDDFVDRGEVERRRGVEEEAALVLGCQVGGDVFVVGGHGPENGWTNLAQLAVARSKGLEPAAQALTDRLAEVLLIELLSDLDQRQSGFVAALADPTVAASRSTLASRFTELVGETPIRYLTRWRVHQATQLLRDTTLPAFRIAELVGYSSPFSFTKAFTRELGVPPTTYRHRPSRAPHSQHAIG